MRMEERRPIRILLVDDHTLFRESLRRLLESETRYNVVAEVASAEAAMELCSGETAFDVALIDYHLGPSAGAQGGVLVLRHLRAHRPHVPALMITAGIESRDLGTIVQELQAGIFLKADPGAEFFIALEKTLRGELWLSSGVGLALLSAAFPTEGTAQAEGSAMTFEVRERAVFELVVEGLSNKEISANLQISESAVKAVLQKLFQKVGVRTRAQLVRFAFESEMGLS